jgi:hypothetical protein
MNLAARDIPTPLCRVPYSRTPIRAVPRSERKTFNGLALKRSPVIVLGPIEANANMRARSGIR